MAKRRRAEDARHRLWYRKLRRLIVDLAHLDPPPQEDPAREPTASTDADQIPDLQYLQELREAGALTDEEFEIARQRLDEPRAE